MFHHAIVGVDGFDGGRDAIALARSLAPEQITLVAAYPVDHLPVRGAPDGYNEILHEDTEKMIRATLEKSGLDAATRVVGDESPARALHETAQIEDADVIVVGSSHRGAVGRVLVGDVARSTVHDAPCAVAVAPHGYRDHPHPIATILVAYDGSAEAADALGLATRIAAQVDGRLVLVEAIKAGRLPERSRKMTDPDAGADREAAEESLREVLAAAGIEGDVRVEVGDPGSVLARASATADLLVAGSRGWGTLRRIVLGSTSDWLVHHAECPVVIAPRPEHAGHPTEAGGEASVTA